MAEATKELSGTGSLVSDLKGLFSVLRTRRIMMFAYGFMFTFVACTAFLAFNPSSSSSSSYRSQFSSIFSYFFPNSSQPIYGYHAPPLQCSFSNSTSPNITTTTPFVLPGRKEGSSGKNQSQITPSPSLKLQPVDTKQVPVSPVKANTIASTSNTTSTISTTAPRPSTGNDTVSVPKVSPVSVGLVNNASDKVVAEPGKTTNLTASLTKGDSGSSEGSSVKQSKENSMDSLMHCNIFYGRWVRDDSYPLYPPGSCPHIDESFNCFLNSRPDGNYQKLRWQPKGCNIPRLNGRDMLELLRGKRLVFVGDSLNRNMWESLVCILRHSVKDKSRVFEASGRREFRTEGSYSFIFEDYNCSVEFFRSPFLVQEWEMPDTNGSKKETLRLDVIERKFDKYKTADIIVFNTGHWWTHKKTSKGKDYYQEGSHIYGELNVVEAFRKALTTWARWVDANIDPSNTMVFFRGYSASHFSGGQWNSGGQCDHETEPIKNETYLNPYPPKMKVLESVMKGMKTHVSYLNITRMTDYRKDAHPSIYRKQSLTEEERRSPLRYQDCSHWCLPGVPDSWNELLYAELLIRHNQKQQQK
uniref:Protein trichome birefringence n=1 Tax=Nelumbo nucifera TaxID=4432 RepID=A0A822ZFJ3_NELNU|nr:TPA_asm: hypothetical protein HUJ06_000415 [Nelumbo nucifera]